MYFRSYFIVSSFLIGSFPHGNSDPTPVATRFTEFLPMVEEYLSEKQPIHYQDNLMLRFLSASHFDLDKAKESLKRHLEWRKTETIDSILEENWADMEERYPYSKTNITNKESVFNVLVLHIGQWNIRKVGDSEEKRFTRYASRKMMEDINNATLSQTHPDLSGGGDITKFTVIVNLKGFSLEKHGCLQCIRLQMEVIEEVGAHWGQAVREIFLANAPDLPGYARSWVEEFSEKFGISVNIRADEKLLEYVDDDLVTSLQVFREHIWVVQEEF